MTSDFLHKRQLGVLLGLVLLSGCAGNGDFPLPTQEAPPPVSRVEQFPRTQVPFPAGQWQEVARDDYAEFRQVPRLGYGPNGGAWYKIPTASATQRAYAQFRDGRIAALYEVETNTVISSYGGFEAPFDCLSGALINRPIYARGQNGGLPNTYDCLLVGPVSVQPPGPEASRFDAELGQFVATHGGVPQQAIEVQISAGYDFNRTDIKLLRFPAVDGVTGTQWQPGAEGPQERAYIAQVVDWAQGFRRLVARGTWRGL